MMSTVSTHRHDHVLVITIQRPEVRNAIDASTSRALADAVDLLDDDPSLRVGVLTGAGGNFCAGLDLRAFLDGQEVAIPGRGLGGMTQAPPCKPMVAAVQGWALAGGFELVLACDLVVAGRSARFGLPEVTRGLVAAGGGALVLPERVPRAIALELLLTGQPMGAERAAAVGLVNRVVDDDEVLDHALDIATTIAANAPLAVQVTKRIATQAPGWPAAERWSRQEGLIAPVFASDDAREGAAAFAEKRRPVWRGH